MPVDSGIDFRYQCRTSTIKEFWQLGEMRASISKSRVTFQILAFFASSLSAVVWSDNNNCQNIAKCEANQRKRRGIASNFIPNFRHFHGSSQLSESGIRALPKICHILQDVLSQIISPSFRDNLIIGNIFIKIIISVNIHPKFVSQKCAIDFEAFLSDPGVPGVRSMGPVLWN